MVLLIVLAAAYYAYTNSAALKARFAAVTAPESFLAAARSELEDTAIEDCAATDERVVGGAHANGGAGFSADASAVSAPVPEESGGVVLVTLPAGLEEPVCAARQGDADHEIRRFSDYALCYRESYELAEWSAYCLERAELTKQATRSNDFRPDPVISTGSAALADYKGSGYDRGHLAPAADFAYSQQAMSETFFMSNMTPQAPAFNRDIWQKLESQVRVWAQKYGRAYVATGPVLSSPASAYETIGKNAVAVPRAFYKVVLVPLYADADDKATPETASDVACFAFIIPNQKCEAPFYDYAVTVDEVEARTGLDFFSLLDDSIEERIESELE